MQTSKLTRVSAIADELHDALSVEILSTPMQLHEKLQLKRLAIVEWSWSSQKVITNGTIHQAI